MGSSPASSLPLARLAGVGGVVFFANAALLVLQLIASRLLAPFIGSDLYTWTSIIGVFLAGIALGNAYGGRIADRYPSPRTLAFLLILGAGAAAWMALAPEVFRLGGLYKNIPLGPRIPALTIVLCLPAGFILSLLTPLSIKLGLPDLSKTGRVAGLIFALSTLGCLLGNYLTGFYLIPAFRINELVLVAAGILVALAAATFAVMRQNPSPGPSPEMGGESAPPSLSGNGVGGSSSSPFAFRDFRHAYLIVFLASFCGMTLELVASRLIAPFLGQSLFTWTGVIGVMLAGTALGNLTGGVLADRASSTGGLRRAVAWVTALVVGLYAFALVSKGLKPLLVTMELWQDFGLDDTKVLFLAFAAALAIGFAVYIGASRVADDLVTPRMVLAGTLIGGGAGSVLIFIALPVLTRSETLPSATLVQQVLIWTFSMFFLPMFVLGMVSPQVIRLSVPDVGQVGRVAGRVYAWSTAGAIAGTFATGYLLVSTLGTYKTIFAVSLILSLLSLAVAPVWRHNVMLYAFSIVLGGITGGMIVYWSPGRDDESVAIVETNYYKIRVAQDQPGELPEGTPRILNLYLDHLLHSSVDPNNPTFIHYEHEHIQMEFLRGARAEEERPRVLVIGGGGYTFPRFAKEIMPEAEMDVVEIDPGVTRVAKQYLGLKDYPGLTITHMDGRQFVAERATPHSYDLIIQDAVNDLSVPSHLMTKEYNDAVKAALKPKGVYLLTIIDEIEHGKLWRAAMATLKQSFKHVTFLTSAEIPGDNPPETGDPEDLEIWRKDWDNWEKTRQVYVIYAADHPLDVNRLRDHNAERMGYSPKAAVVGGAGMATVTFPFFTHAVDERRLEPQLLREPGVVLTDQYAPVDNLMADVFRRR